MPIIAIANKRCARRRPPRHVDAAQRPAPYGTRPQFVHPVQVVQRSDMTPRGTMWGPERVHNERGSCAGGISRLSVCGAQARDASHPPEGGLSARGGEWSERDFVRSVPCYQRIQAACSGRCGVLGTEHFVAAGERLRTSGAGGNEDVVARVINSCCSFFVKAQEKGLRLVI